MAFVQAQKIPIGGRITLDDGSIYERKPRFTFEVEVEAEHGPESPSQWPLVYWKCMNSQGPHWATTRADYNLVIRDGFVKFSAETEKEIGRRHAPECPDYKEENSQYEDVEPDDSAHWDFGT